MCSQIKMAFLLPVERQNNIDTKYVLISKFYGAIFRGVNSDFENIGLLLWFFFFFLKEGL